MQADVRHRIALPSLHASRPGGMSAQGFPPTGTRVSSQGLAWGQGTSLKTTLQVRVLNRMRDHCQHTGWDR